MARHCSGCGAYFASVEAFELHATGLEHPLRNAPRRCRTAEEMRALGMGMKPGTRNWLAQALPRRKRKPYDGPIFRNSRSGPR